MVGGRAIAACLVTRPVYISGAVGGRQQCGGDMSKAAPQLQADYASPQSARTPGGYVEKFSTSQVWSPHSKVWKCRYCGAVFTSYASLLGHTNSVHLNRQQFVCEACGKGFSQSEHYNDHINMHRHVKAHQCPCCSAQFTYKTNLRRHLRSGVCSRNLPGDQFQGSHYKGSQYQASPLPSQAVDQFQGSLPPQIVDQFQGSLDQSSVPPKESDQSRGQGSFDWQGSVAPHDETAFVPEGKF